MITNRYYVPLFLLLITCNIRNESTWRLTIWNVGQGSWATAVTEDTCSHFDAGGEKNAFKAISPAIRKLCKSKRNELSLSHWDWDHLSYIRRLKNIFLNFCVLHPPHGRAPSINKKNIFNEITNCTYSGDSIEELKFSYNRRVSNETSRVFTFQHKFLLPGDSIRKNERLWGAKINPSIEVISLGHHGSKTSTGPELLKNLPNLKTAVASANPNFYGHPHHEVKVRLRRYGISLLETKDWGNIHFYFYPRNGRSSISRSRATGS